MPTDRSSITPRRYALQSLFGPGQDGMVSHTPHAAHLGIRVVETGPGFGVCALPFREELIGDHGGGGSLAGGSRPLSATPSGSPSPARGGGCRRAPPSLSRAGTLAP